jgi:hypothetical protein
MKLLDSAASSTTCKAPSKSLALPQDRILAAQGLGASSFRAAPGVFLKAEQPILTDDHL